MAEVKKKVVVYFYDRGSEEKGRGPSEEDGPNTMFVDGRAVFPHLCQVPITSQSESSRSDGRTDGRRMGGLLRLALPSVYSRDVTHTRPSP